MTNIVRWMETIRSLCLEMGKREHIFCFRCLCYGRGVLDLWDSVKDFLKDNFERHGSIFDSVIRGITLFPMMTIFYCFFCCCCLKLYLIFYNETNKQTNKQTNNNNKTKTTTTTTKQPTNQTNSTFNNKLINTYVEHPTNLQMCELCFISRLWL